MAITFVGTLRELSELRKVLEEFKEVNEESEPGLRDSLWVMEDCSVAESIAFLENNISDVEELAAELGYETHRATCKRQGRIFEFRPSGAQHPVMQAMVIEGCDKKKE